MDKISVLIITKNEEDVIGDCIKSVKDFASEVIVIDGGSTDNTIKIADKLGAKVIKNPFKNFSDQRNLALSAAHEKWIFYIDSDERASDEFAAELKEKIALFDDQDDVAGFWVERKTFYLGRDWHLKDRVQRVFKKDKLKEWHGVVHETPDVNGKLFEIASPILHYTHRNIEQMLAKTNEWSEYEAELRFRAGHPKMSWWRFPRVMISAFFGSYLLNNGFRNGTAGLIEAIFQSYSMYITYAKLWELQNGRTSSR